MNEVIRNFTSFARIPVTFTFDHTPFTGRVREVRTFVEYRGGRDSASYRSSDDGYGFAAGFILGTAF